ncbi:acetolactate synthase small subunit [Paraferrimonas sedimenticola]|uniref:Acetolactate synthase small subunit n=1 Tax=Paraferrimonas sedimenticola TaxID=375674 RepID=A0AA37S039_9GAMM|nr:acetolactate synthase small subunit [Paraferrimonas sedimenticola]GLP97927.1 acetolactate synthase small subunit [Paraferrimonas sedimenticola]
MKRIVSLLMENQSGALSRVVGLFSQRGYNIESLSVSATEDPTLSRLTITTSVDEQALEQIDKQLNKLVDVLKVMDITETDHIEREIALIKVKANTPASRDEIQRLSDIFRGQIVDAGTQVYTVQLAGRSSKLDAFIQSVTKISEVIEVSRSGIVGLCRGDRALRA